MAPILVRSSNGTATLQEESETRPCTKTERTFGSDDTSAAIVAVITLAAIPVVLGPFLLTSSTIVALIITLITFIVIRHVAIINSRGPVQTAWANARTPASPKTAHLPAIYFTYVLGSGGHTGELSYVMRQQFRASPNLHRRYIISSGDTHSSHVLSDFENRVAKAHPTPGEAGTWDVFRVIRARRVHQPLWSAAFSSVASALSIVYALLAPPADRTGKKEFNTPHVIITNGPGTGFIVCAVAHILKIFFIVPQSKARMVYIETWAHISTLSLTGRLFHLTGIADVFMVQHRKLADKTGKLYVGEIAPTGNLLGLKE